MSKVRRCDICGNTAEKSEVKYIFKKRPWALFFRDYSWDGMELYPMDMCVDCFNDLVRLCKRNRKDKKDK